LSHRLDCAPGSALRWPSSPTAPPIVNCLKSNRQLIPRSVVNGRPYLHEFAPRKIQTNSINVLGLISHQAKNSPLYRPS
jgi:hypothetical protein